MSKASTQKSVPAATAEDPGESTELDGGMVVRPIGQMRAPAKSGAIKSLVERLVENGHSEPGAFAVARAVVDPADTRRRLAHPSALHVPGGTLYGVSVPVWAHAVIPYPANTREASARRYPVAVPPGSSEVAKYAPPRDVRTSEASAAELALAMEGRDHVIWALDRSAEYLEQKNNLQESIALQGVMLPVTAAVLEISHERQRPPSVAVLAAADGSSRVAACHRLLGATPQDVVYGLPADDRRFRREIEQIRAVYNRPAAEVAESEVRRLRALQLPATIILSFEPDEGSDVDFAGAIRSYVGLLHVEPPEKWDDAAELDAKGDSALNELVVRGAIEEPEREYLAGMMTPAQAIRGGFSPWIDERAARIVNIFTSRDEPLKKAVGVGIKRLSAKSKLMRPERAEVGTELALRAIRNGPLGSHIGTTRAALGRACQYRGLWEFRWEVTGRSPEDLRDAALAELAAGSPGSSAMELATLGVFWLTAYRSLVREVRGGDDNRAPQVILGALASSTHGIRTLYQAVVDGRADRAPRSVTAEGKLEPNVSGRSHEINDEWLRRTFPPVTTPSSSGPSQPAPAPSSSPTQQLQARRERVRNAVEVLEQAVDELDSVLGVGGQPLIDHDGFPNDLADDLSSRLDAVGRKLARYGYVWEQRLPAEGDTIADEDVAQDGDAS
jgi:hypothetical protein